MCSMVLKVGSLFFLGSCFLFVVVSTIGLINWKKVKKIDSESNATSNLLPPSSPSYSYIHVRDHHSNITTSA
jgi:hypothetical protein